MKKINKLTLIALVALMCATMVFSVSAFAADEAVATIGETEFESLAEAVATAEDGDEIVLLGDVDLGSEMLTVKKQVTINLNGKNITSAYEGDYAAIYVGTAGDLTITGEGAITAAEVAIGNYGKVTILGGTISGEAALYNYYYNETTFGVAVISGGQLDNVWNCGDMTVSGGEIAYLDNTHKLTVTDGTIGELVIGEADYAPVGGTSATVAEGTVQNTNAVARIGNTYYTTLAEAVDAADEGDEIVLLGDVDLGSEMLTVKKQVTINLNGKNITSAYEGDYAAIYVGTAGDLTITGEGAITAAEVAIGNYGKVTILGGTISGEAALYNYYYNETTFGVAVISGGQLDNVWNCGDMTVSGGEIAYLDNTHKLTVTDGTIGELVIGEADYAPVGGTSATVAEGTVQNTNAVARIGNTYYTTLAEAVDAADEGDEIVLFKAVVVGDGETVTIDKNVTITTSVTDVFTVNAGGILNLGAVTVNSTSSILWANGGTINIDGAVLSQTGSTYSAVFAENDGQINLKSGKIEANNNPSVTVSLKGATLNVSGGQILHDSCSAVAAKNGATVTVTGGEIKTTAEEAYCAAFAGSNAEIIVSGGEISAANGYGLVAIADGKVTVTGGTVDSVRAHENANASAVISGGTINGSVTAANDATVTVTGGSFEQDATVFCDADHHTVKGEDDRYIYGAHAFDNEWATDATNHWHECDCGAIANLGEHTYEEGSCTDCGMNDGIPPTGDSVLVPVVVIMMLSVAAIVVLNKKRVIA